MHDHNILITFSPFSPVDTRAYTFFGEHTFFRVFIKNYNVMRRNTRTRGTTVLVTILCFGRVPRRSVVQSATAAGLGTGRLHVRSRLHGYVHGDFSDESRTELNLFIIIITIFVRRKQRSVREKRRDFRAKSR